MASKPETTFIGSVHKHLKGSIHFEKMHNPYRGGTWDVWYSGPKADLWIEYKFIVVPVHAMVTPALSELQLEWGRKRHAEGRNLAVIVGCKAGGVILQDLAWEPPIPNDSFKSALKTRAAISEWILHRTGG